MSEDHKDIGKLLKSIHEGLQKYSVQELNRAIVTTLKKSGKEYSIVKIDYALQMVCDEYNITRFTLIHTKDRGEIQDAKRIAYCLLHLDIGLTIRHIAENVFGCYHNSVASGIKKLRYAKQNIKHEKELIERYRLLSEKLKNYINEQNQIEQIEHENIS
jgi:chromosomal replication initiation ATPase DnaA